MKVSASQPFQIIYSLYQHEYLGYQFESFVVHLDDKGKLTLQHQNISAKNAPEFANGLDNTDYELIDLMDSMQQDAVAKHFNKKGMKSEDFFLKVYTTNHKANEAIQAEIHDYMEKRRAKILERLGGKHVYEMGNDGEPAWKEIKVQDEKATVLFHFRRNEDNTHYFPTIKHRGEKLDFQYKSAYLVCMEPAWMVLGGKLFSFEKDLDGKKIQPFLNKKFIIIPRNVEETYYNKFVAPLIASFDVYAKGFEINTEKYEPQPLLSFSEVTSVTHPDIAKSNGQESEGPGQLLFELGFKYGPFKFKADNVGDVSVTVEKKGDDYIFHRVQRALRKEKKILDFLKKSGMVFNHSKAVIPKTVAFSWLDENREELEKRDFILTQKDNNRKKYFLGHYQIDIEVRENILRKKLEFALPNGEIAVIPDSWIVEYSELFAFAEEGDEGGNKLKKHHLTLVQNLDTGNLAKVIMSRKLEALRDFTGIEDAEIPVKFKGSLRPYQKAGYNWLKFLNEYKFGGCLADDMGLGKTVQTLAFLQHLKEAGQQGPSLLVMPTSLVYNWEKEARKFTPNLKSFTYTGTNRDKNPENFKKYDLIFTSYGIVRLDIELLKDFAFNYIILDESQAIKNPSSNIAKAVNKLTSRGRLILTGTPLENSTMDLWSQMNFINTGLLGQPD